MSNAPNGVAEPAEGCDLDSSLKDYYSLVR